MQQFGIHRLAGLSIMVVATLAAPGLITAQLIYEPYTFTTLAGSAGQRGSADGTGSDARFRYPAGVAVDRADNVYVADYYNSTIRKVTASGVVTTLAGRAGSFGSTDGTGNEARFNYPQRVAVDDTGNVYVADFANHTIRSITPAGTVTTLAGQAGSPGSADGPGDAAQFYFPNGVAVDGAGNVYVADSSNNTIRKVTAAGVVTTLAGLAETTGSADGTGSDARFYRPSGVAVDEAGNVYVADSGNETIRKVTPAGAVTTLAGQAGNLGSADGPGSAARFHDPRGVAVDGAGNVYVTDPWYNTIRKVTAAGVVTTLAGQAGALSSADGTGIAARFNSPAGIAVDGMGNVYVADEGNDTIRKGSTTHLRAPTITLGPASQTVMPGSNVTFLVVAVGTPLNYQWLFNGTAMLGQTNASLLLTNVQTNQSGLYAVTASNEVASITSSAATLAVVQQFPLEVQFRMALQAGGLVKWEQDGLIALTQTVSVTNDTVLDATGHAMVVNGQNKLRVFLVSSNVHLTLINVTVANGLGDQGGGIYNDGGTVHLSNCVFKANQAFGVLPNDRVTPAARGGAIYSVGGQVAATNCLFALNSAIPAPSASGTVVLEARGGALGIQDGVLKLVNCQFATNQASGGIQYYLAGMWHITKGSAFGGAVYVINTESYVSGCRFEHNLAQSPLFHDVGLDNGADVLGGAGHQEGTGLLQLKDCVFVENQSSGGGGGRDGYSGDGRGGAVSAYGNLLAEGCTFSGNTCSGGGLSFNGGNALGGALFTTNNAILNQCLFSLNGAQGGGPCGCGIQLGPNAYSGGGAVYAQGALQIRNTTFASNWVGSDGLMYPEPFLRPGSSAGGALFCGAVCVATNSTWYHNQAKAQAEVIFIGAHAIEGAVAGAAIYQTGNPLTLVHCTIVSNTVVGVTNNPGAAITLVTNAVARLNACLVAGNNKGNLAGSVVDQGFNLSSDHSVVFTNVTSRNDVEPKLGAFGDHGGPTPTLALMPDSPAIDAITSGPCPDTDQRGVPRPVGAACDIGAFEFVPDAVLSFDAQGVFQFAEVLQPVRDYQIDVSTNLIDWMLFSANRSDNLGKLTFTDTAATNVPYRFFRLTPKE
jgi:hypothetical protein